MSLFGGAPWLPAPCFVETLISPVAREPAVRGSEAGQLHTLQGPVENENVRALMQQLLRFTMVTAEHQASVGVLLRAGPLPPPRTVCTPLQPGLDGEFKVCSVWIKSVALPFG